MKGRESCRSRDLVLALGNTWFPSLFSKFGARCEQFRTASEHFLASPMSTCPFGVWGSMDHSRQHHGQDDLCLAFQAVPSYPN